MKSILVATVLLGSLSATAARAAPAYKLTRSILLGAPDRWDYAVFSPATDRVYVAHGDRLTVIDARSATIAGEVEGVPGGTHGTAVSPDTGQGFTDDGKNGEAVAFDLKTLKVTHRIPADVDADAITIDPLTGHVFVIEGDPGAMTVIDPRNDSVVGTIKAGEKLEYAVPDGRGMIYIAGVENGDLLKVDARTDWVIGQWRAAGCVKPHGLAIDPEHHRLFMGCSNSVMMVMDGDSGRIVTTLPIGRGNDAVAYDPKRRRVFSSNGVDGTITAYQQVSANSYTPLAPITTKVSGRTMTVDPQTGRLFVPAADVDPSSPPGGRPRPRAGTLQLLVFDPVR